LLSRLWTAEESEQKGSQRKQRHEVPVSSDAVDCQARRWSIAAFHCRAVYGPPSARAGETGVAPRRARERDSTGCRSGATVEREVSEGSESPERSRRTKPGIYGEAMERQDASGEGEDVSERGYPPRYNPPLQT